VQVLSLGAGFDTTFFNLSAKYSQAPTTTTLPMMMTYYEVDLDTNVERKSALIRRSSKCRKYLGKILGNKSKLSYFFTN
jgi:O-methyltransferase involved in polyketide biosynthesis